MLPTYTAIKDYIAKKNNIKDPLKSELMMENLPLDEFIKLSEDKPWTLGT